MFKKLICFIWGHQFTSKAYTGRTVKIVGTLTNDKYEHAIYEHIQLQFCPLCGTLNPNYNEWKKQTLEWKNYQSEPAQRR